MANTNSNWTQVSKEIVIPYLQQMPKVQEFTVDDVIAACDLDWQLNACGVQTLLRVNNGKVLNGRRLVRKDDLVPEIWRWE